MKNRKNISGWFLGIHVTSFHLWYKLIKNVLFVTESEDTMNPGVFKVTVGGEQTIKCELKFRPTEVASYDFVIPVSINQTEAPTPEGTPFPPTPAPSSKSIQHIIAPRPVVVAVSTPKRRIIATALRQPSTGVDDRSALHITFWLSGNG